jgi:hypothetical protein
MTEPQSMGTGEAPGSDSQKRPGSGASLGSVSVMDLYH